MEDLLIEKMCKMACKFYKEGDDIDEDEKRQCGGFRILMHQLKEGLLDEKKFHEIAKAVDINISEDKPLTKLDIFLVKNLCKVACGFYSKDEHGEGDEYLQCGGYRMIRYQIKSGMLDTEKVKKLVKEAVSN